MRIIAESRLKRLADGHGDCIDQVAVWIRILRSARWRSLADVRATYPHADPVGDLTVFNIKDSDYRSLDRPLGLASAQFHRGILAFFLGRL